MSVAQIQRRMESILVYMESYWDFVNCHMVNYLIDDHWTSYVPKNLKDEVKNIDEVKKCIESVFWKNEQSNKFPEFVKFVSTAQQHACAQFPEITTLQQLQTILLNDEQQHHSKTSLSIKEFMSEKKQHEVEITATLVHNLIESYGNKLKNNNDETKEEMFIIDAGDGKGYLSSRLSLEYGYKVLGIDANKTNTENALKRSTKLQRAWNGLTERAILIEAGIKPVARGRKIKNTSNEAMKKGKITTNTNSSSSYCTASQYITTDVNLLQLLRTYFSDVNLPAVCLTGLHTCGNLATTCLQVFHAQPLCRILCNIGCCYHLLSEAYSGPDEFGNLSLVEQQSDFIGFPMSSYLNERRVKLGRNARMLAAQSIERTLAARELPNLSLYYRALLEVILKSEHYNLRHTAQVGKVKKYQNFQEYFELCMFKLNMNAENVTVAYIAELQQKYHENNDYLNLFYLLRQCLAPVVESLILLDRLLYLKELNYEHSFLVPIFNAVTSPRHFGIFALKV